MEITKEQYEEALEIVRLYELQIRERQKFDSFPILDDTMELQYRDMTGRWYKYDDNMKRNVYFNPEMVRVKNLLLIDNT